MPAQQQLLPRRRQPELELDASRMPSLGYEAAEDVGFIRCLDHGYPTPLARWHYHDEYELHLIVATSGKAFVGDWIGQFQPGHLVLTGPRLPHNWISLDLPDGGVRLRDRVIQFHHEPIAKACAQRLGARGGAAAAGASAQRHRVLRLVGSRARLLRENQEQPRPRALRGVLPVHGRSGALHRLSAAVQCATAELRRRRRRSNRSTAS